MKRALITLNVPDDFDPEGFVYWLGSACHRELGVHAEVYNEIDATVYGSEMEYIADLIELGTGTDPLAVAADAWTDMALKAKIEKLLPTLTDPVSAVAAVMAVLGNLYDSIDRELAFTLVSNDKGWPYDDLYNAWIEGTWN